MNRLHRTPHRPRAARSTDRPRAGRWSARPWALALALVTAASCRVYAPVGTQGGPAKVDYSKQLPVGADALLALGPDEKAPDLRRTWHERAELLPALEESLNWTRRKHAASFFPQAGVSHSRALRSLERFHALLTGTESADAFVAAVTAEFQVYKSAGWDGRGGGVLFTGYCTPILRGSLTQRAGYEHPLYALPEDLAKASDGAILGQRIGGRIEPYPTRRAIEANALLANRGLELVWLADPIDAYIAHVNGSAFIELPDGSELRLGYAGKNGRPYTSLGKELIAAGRVTAERMNLAAIRSWAQSQPGEVREFLQRNDSYVFFAPLSGNPHGSLDVPVSGLRSLATDKSIFPRGAITFVEATLPTPNGSSRSFQQLMLDQDTGGAIRTAGRADIYVGIGPDAERISGATQSPGQLYYYFLRS